MKSARVYALLTNAEIVWADAVFGFFFYDVTYVLISRRYNSVFWDVANVYNCQGNSHVVCCFTSCVWM